MPLAQLVPLGQFAIRVPALREPSLPAMALYPSTPTVSPDRASSSSAITRVRRTALMIAVGLSQRCGASLASA